MILITREISVRLLTRVYVFLLAPSMKFILNLKLIVIQKNIWLDPVYSKEHCGIYLLLPQRIFGKIFKNYYWDIENNNVNNVG